MKIILTSVMVDDQQKALDFYTNVLGFVKKHDVPVGGDFRWLTVVSKDEQESTALLLEPMGFAPAKVYQKQLFDAGIPLTAFGVDDIDEEYERLRKLGVVFRSGPQVMGPVKLAVFEDTCGNLIQMMEQV